MARKRKATQKKGREEEAFLKEPGFKKVDIGRKLIPLSVLSGKEAEKNAERTVDNVLQAVTHVLSEGDLSIVDFGRFKASRNKRNGFIRIAFTPSGKLKRAVEARLNALPSPDPEPETTSEPDAQPAPAVDPQIASPADTASGAASQSESAPPPEQPQTPEVVASADPATTAAEETAPSPDAPAEQGADTNQAVGSEAEDSPSWGDEGGSSCDPALPPDAFPGTNLESVSAENRTLVADGREYGIAENLSIFDTNGNVMSFSDQAAALQHLALVSRITVLSKTAFRVQATSVVEIINSLQILQYRE